MRPTTLQPKTERQAFEIERITDRSNFVFIWEPEKGPHGTIEVWDTSRSVIARHGRKGKYWDKDDSETAYQRFCDIYNDSIRSFATPFLGWVDPDTIVPIEELNEMEEHQNG
jgi:hypothetical protein